MNSIHIGDLHIKIPEKNEQWYIKRLVNFFKAVKDENADEVLITGDIFDRTPSSLEIALFLGFLMDLEVPTYIVAGNHDRSNRTSVRSEYLEVLLKLINIPRIHWACREIVETSQFVMVPNYCIRQGQEIPIVKDKILLSHIRHELYIAGKPRKAEYDISKLKEYKLVLLSDIHTTFKFTDNVFYSTSPYRTTRKSIIELGEIDNSIFGYNLVTNSHVEHKELHLPNHYILRTGEKIGEVTNENLIDIEYQISYDQIGEFAGENVVIAKEDNDIEFNKDIYSVITEILTKDYNIKTPSNYIDLLISIVGELNVN